VREKIKQKQEDMKKEFDGERKMEK